MSSPITTGKKKKTITKLVSQQQKKRKKKKEKKKDRCGILCTFLVCMAINLPSFFLFFFNYRGSKYGIR